MNSPPFTIVSVDRAGNGGAWMVVRKAGGQQRKVWVPARNVNGPLLEALAADMVDQWPDRPRDATGE